MSRRIGIGEYHRRPAFGRPSSRPPLDSRVTAAWPATWRYKSSIRSAVLDNRSTLTKLFRGMKCQKCRRPRCKIWRHPFTRHHLAFDHFRGIIRREKAFTTLIGVPISNEPFPFQTQTFPLTVLGLNCFIFFRLPMIMRRWRVFGDSLRLAISAQVSMFNEPSCNLCGALGSDTFMGLLTRNWATSSDLVYLIFNTWWASKCDKYSRKMVALSIKTNKNIRVRLGSF